MNKITLPHNELLLLKRMNTPTIYNGWEQITKKDIARDCFNLEETTDFMPHMGPMVGYAVTAIIEPSQSSHRSRNSSAWSEYRRYVASVPGPKIVIIQDLDKPQTLGSFWGEVNSNTHRSLGCVGSITDGGLRDLDEINNVGFKILARQLCVGHAHVIPVRWNCSVEVFGCKIEPGQLIHADKHGFLAIPLEDRKGLLEAAQFMDNNECNTVIKAARDTTGLSIDQILAQLDQANQEFNNAVEHRFSNHGEW